jgi:hypothetical protein
LLLGLSFLGAQDPGGLGRGTLASVSQPEPNHRRHGSEDRAAEGGAAAAAAGQRWFRRLWHDVPGHAPQACVAMRLHRRVARRPPRRWPQGGPISSSAAPRATRSRGAPEILTETLPRRASLGHGDNERCTDEGKPNGVLFSAPRDRADRQATRDRPHRGRHVN